MEEGQYGQHVVGGNPRAYMTMRDYRNLAWQNQQPVERNPNPCRSMREYRDQWMSTPSYSVTPTYAPPPHPQYASLSQPQPPQPISLVEQAILDLTKLVGNAVEEQKKFNAQLSQKIHTMENSLKHKLDGLQSEVGQQFDSLQCSISRLAQQHVHQEKENPEKECLIDTTVEEQYKQQDEAISPLLTEKGSGHETVEGTPEPIIQPIPINLYPSAIAQPKISPLAASSSPDLMYILLATQSQPKTPEAPTTKASLALPALKSLKKLVATVRISATTSKTQVTAYIAWHSGWFRCRFGFGAPEPRHF